MPDVKDPDVGFDLVIEAGRTRGQYWRDLWRYRGLLYFLAWRDVLVLYKQTTIGVAWAVVRPVLTMIAFTFIFGRLARLPADGTPYPLLVFCAVLPWQLFSSAVQSASSSLIESSSLVSKVYFPRLIIPASAVVTSFVEFGISLVILLGMLVYYGVRPGWSILSLPLFVLLCLAAAFGVGLWLSALNVKYRDFRYVVPFLLQLALFVSPVGFTSSVVPERWRTVYSLNPMAGVIDGFRWSVLGERAGLHVEGLGVSALLTAFVLLTGLWYFRRVERTFADVI